MQAGNGQHPWTVSRFAGIELFPCMTYLHQDEEAARKMAFTQLSCSNRPAERRYLYELDGEFPHGVAEVVAWRSAVTHGVLRCVEFWLTDDEIVDALERRLCR